MPSTRSSVVVLGLVLCLAVGDPRSFAAPSKTPSTPVITLTGADAKAHIQKVWDAHPEQAARQMAEMRARGWTPTELYLVKMAAPSAPTLVDRALEWLSPTLHAQWSGVGTPEGEVHYWAWDDGDPGTWEGWHKGWNYSTNQAVETYAHLSIAQHQGFGLLWTPDARDIRYFQDLGVCLGLGCSGSAMTCGWSGPVWSQCTFTGCLGFVFGCSMRGLYDMWNRKYENMQRYGCQGTTVNGANDC